MEDEIVVLRLHKTLRLLCCLPTIDYPRPRSSVELEFPI